MGSGSGMTVGKYITKVPGGIARSVAEFTTEPGHAREYAAEFQQRYNENNETLHRYLTERLDADLDGAVVALRFSDRQGNHAGRYLVSTDEGATSPGTNARIIGPERFDRLGASVDHRIGADWYLSHNAADELQTFVEKYAEPGTDVPNSYVAKMAMKYGDSVEGDLWDRVTAPYM